MGNGLDGVLPNRCTQLAFSLRTLVIFSGWSQRPLIELDVFFSSVEKEMYWFCSLFSSTLSTAKISCVIIVLFIISLMLLILEHCVHFKIPQPKKDKKNKEMENSFFLRKGVIQLFPAFLKFALHHFTLMKDRHQSLFSLTKRNRAFVRKVKVKIGFRVCSVVLSYYGDNTPRIIMRAAAGFLPWEPGAASQHQAAIALRCVSGHWCFFFFL